MYKRRMAVLARPATALLAALFALVILAGCSAPNSRGQFDYFASPTTEAYLPAAEATAQALGTLPPQTPIVWPTPGPHPTPPVAELYAKNILKDANMAWGVRNAGGLAVWTARYTGKAELAAQPVITWNVPLDLVDLAASPDRQALAVLARERPTDVDEGLPTATYLYVVDLATNAVRSVPDYASHYETYVQYLGDRSEHIIGWLDNDSFAVQAFGPARPKVVSRDGASYSELPFQLQQPDFLVGTALSPDRKTFVAGRGAVDPGLWTFDLKGLIKKVGASASPRGAVWSPDGRYITYYAPQTSGLPDGQVVDYSQSKLWLLDVEKSMEYELSTDDSWDTAPTWSPDSTQIAFLRAEGSAARDRRNHAGNLKTRVYVANVADLKVRPWSDSPGTYNLDVVWTDSGDVVTLSKDSESGAVTNLRAASSGKESYYLLDTPASGSLVQLTLLK